MKSNTNKNIILCPPNPEYLIKSIAEQGYSLQTAFADLIDNSISAKANKIEILSSTKKEFIIYITDNGDGMTNEKLLSSMTIPSSSIDEIRHESDLGHFGLGLKTASFSQTRELIVISKQASDKTYNGYAWDVNYLKITEDWTLKKLNNNEINNYINSYKETSTYHLESFEEYIPNTIIIWTGLYKYENFLKDENKENALNSDLTNNVEDYISIAFHRFIDNGLKIRLNNKLVQAFNPFPTNDAIIKIPSRIGVINNSNVKFESIVLPNKAIKESKNLNNLWVTQNKSLMDMEGIYIYRGDRLIAYGGWHNITKRSGKLQLGRMKIDIGNNIDKLLKLNVAKSQIEIPYELKQVFYEELLDLQEKAQTEFYSIGLGEINDPIKPKMKPLELFKKAYTPKGAILYINESNPLVEFLMESFDKDQSKLFKVLIKNINSVFNKNRQFESDLIIGSDESPIDKEAIDPIIAKLRELNIDEETIKVYISNITIAKQKQ
jgi:hypothetical protein